jgi:hypothetical protein
MKDDIFLFKNWQKAIYDMATNNKSNFLFNAVYALFIYRKVIKTLRKDSKFHNFSRKKFFTLKVRISSPKLVVLYS